MPIPMRSIGEMQAPLLRHLAWVARQGQLQLAVARLIGARATGMTGASRGGLLSEGEISTEAGVDTGLTGGRATVASAVTGSGGRIGICHAGSAHEATGRTSSPTIVRHQIECRRAAEDFWQSRAASQATSSNTVPLAEVSSRIVVNERASVSSSMTIFPPLWLA